MKKRHRQLCVLASEAFASGICAAGLLLTAALAQAKLTPEKESARLGKILKPISNEKWEGIAGPKFLEKYSVVKGDTLSGISKSLFGDPRYWPKMWAINNAIITNPHWLKPGYQIAFASDGQPQGVSETDAPKGFVSNRGGPRSMQWKELPSQNWDYFERDSAGIQVDALGFDMSPPGPPLKTSGVAPTALPASEELPYLAKIVGASSEAEFLSSGELVFIEGATSSPDIVKKGEVYAITERPQLLKSVKSDRTGYGYPILGQVKILGTREKLFIGRLLNVQDFAPRGALLIPLPSRIPALTPIPGPRPLLGTIQVGRNSALSLTAQHKVVFIDRGSDDGIKPGMIFRAFVHVDRFTKKHVINSNFVIEADLIVTQTSPTYCTADILHSYSTLSDDSPAVLLTDLSDLNRNNGFSEKGALVEDDLDSLDNGQGMNNAEKRELKQLENWKDSEPPSAEPEVPQTPPDATPEITPDMQGEEMIQMEQPAPPGSPPTTGDAPVTAPIESAAPTEEFKQGAPTPIAPDTATSPEISVPPTDQTLPELPTN